MLTKFIFVCSYSKYKVSEFFTAFLKFYVIMSNYYVIVNGHYISTSSSIISSSILTALILTHSHFRSRFFFLQNSGSGSDLLSLKDLVVTQKCTCKKLLCSQKNTLYWHIQNNATHLTNVFVKVTISFLQCDNLSIGVIIRINYDFRNTHLVNHSQ